MAPGIKKTLIGLVLLSILLVAGGIFTLPRLSFKLLFFLLSFSYPHFSVCEFSSFFHFLPVNQ